MPRERKGSVLKRKDGSIFARVTFVDSASGKRKDKLRRAANRTHARELIKEMLREVDDYGEQSLDTSRKTFADLADYYEKHYLIEAKYKNGKKISGLRSLAPSRGVLKTLCDHFGKRLLRTITYGNVLALRSLRLETKTRHDKERNVGTVNRELALLRRMFNIAKREGWLLKNPMENGESLIKAADEHKRERVLTFEEEERLLTACGERTINYVRYGKQITAKDSGEKRKHLRAIIIAAIETGMRKGELLKLKWKDIDFENQVITIQALNTKTLKMREVPISDRLKIELEQLLKISLQDLNSTVFGLLNVKKSFEGARRVANLPDIRFHDLRHTYATRLISAHIPVAEVARTLGHQQLATTYRYTNQTRESTKRIADALTMMRSATLQAPKENS